MFPAPHVPVIVRIDPPFGRMWFDHDTMKVRFEPRPTK